MHSQNTKNRNQIDRETLITVMENTARGAGEIIRSAVQDQFHTKTKTSFRDVVTQYDVQVQEYVIRTLTEAFPDAVYISEEKAEFRPKEGCLTFVIDPIDGTANFVHHCQHSCVSIGCVQDGEPVAGVVYDPFLEELFSAKKGGGAYLNGTLLRIPDHSLAETLVYFGSAPYNMELAEETFQNVRKIFGRCQDIRRSGSAALDLCSVAAGRAGLFFESILSVWDYAAGALIVQEAGGVCMGLDGASLVFDRPVKHSVIAGSRQVMEESGLMKKLSPESNRFEDGSEASGITSNETRNAKEDLVEGTVRQKYAEVTRRLIETKTSITTMESCTAGMIASLVTDTEGASEILKGAFVTYSNEAKLLHGVPQEILETYGVYSEETACSMAQACREAYGADIGIGVTGSFGNPDPNNADSVPGEVYYAIAGEDGVQGYPCRVPAQPSRADYKLYVADAIADALLEFL